MSKLSNAKDVNKTMLHNANQIAEFIKFFSEEFSENNDNDSLEKLNFLNIAFALVPVKLHPLFGNNLAKTGFPSYSNKILMKYLDGANDDVFKKLLESTLSLIWNMTDSSEPFCKNMMACERFSANLVHVLQDTEYTIDSKHTVESSVSIINNIIRRDSFRHTFDKFDIIDRVKDIEKSPLMNRDQRIICVAIVFYMVPDNKVKEIVDLADDIRDDVIQIIDAASNNENFSAEGFSLRELMDVMTIICRDSATKSRAGNNQTLMFTLLRLLGKNYQPDRVLTLAKAMYTETQLAKFKANYVDKYGETNADVMKQFDRV